MHVEHIFLVGDLLPDGEGEALVAVGRVPDALVALQRKVGLDQALSPKREKTRVLKNKRAEHKGADWFETLNCCNRNRELSYVKL